MGSYLFIFFTILILLFSSYEWHLMTKNKTHKIYGLIFLIISFYSFYSLSNQYLEILLIILICISTDIGGYVFGKILKGPKLTKISPNKTYAGMFGGFILALTFTLLINNFVEYSKPSTQFIVIVLIISSVSQIGDIIVSYFKRLSNIKNTGNIIPGHGGLLDRIDGMIFAFPTYYFFQLNGYLNI